VRFDGTLFEPSTIHDWIVYYVTFVIVEGELLSMVMSIAHTQANRSKYKHLPSRFPIRSLGMLEVYSHGDYWGLLSLVWWEYLEFYILIQEWILPQQGISALSLYT